jgi:hypothetical protein
MAFWPPFVPSHVVEMVERVLARYERLREALGVDSGFGKPSA